MADRLTLQTVQLKSFGRDDKCGTATFSAGISAKLLDAMEWAEIPECASSASMAGELAASLVQLTPKDKALERHAIDLDTTLVYGFTVVRRELEGQRAKGFRQELHFKVDFSDPQGCKKLEAYKLSCAKSSMVISYTKQPKQEDLPGTELEAGDDRQATLTQ
jgi:hypothetical protein